MRRTSGRPPGRAAEAAEKDLGNVDLTFVMNPEFSAAVQQRNVDDMLAKGVDGLAISPVSPKDQVPMLNRVASQCLLITQDSDAPDSNRACYIGTNNTAAGEQAGEALKKALPNGGNVMVFVGQADAQNALDRINGIKKVIEGSGINILDVRTDDADPVRAKTNAVDTITKYPDIAALVGIYSYNGPAIANAVRDNNAVGKIKVVCFDDDPATFQAIKDGVISATVVQQPYEFGYKAITVMEKTLSGDKTAIPADKKIIIPTLVVDKANVDEFIAKQQELKSKK